MSNVEMIKKILEVKNACDDFDRVGDTCKFTIMNQDSDDEDIEDECEVSPRDEELIDISEYIICVMGSPNR